MRSAAHLELVRGSITTAATMAHQRTLPVASELQNLVPSGSIQRGSTLAVHGVGATSLALALVGQAVRDGSFLAIVAPSSFGLASCLDFDIPLRRVVQFVLGSSPGSGSSGSGSSGSGSPEKWGQAVAAVVEGFDLVVLADRQRVTASQARQLTARNRERGSVLVRVGGPAWADAADLRFDVAAPDWSGLGRGHGHLQSRRVAVKVAGRRYHRGDAAHHLLLPAIGGGAEAASVLRHERFAGSDIDDMLDATRDARAEVGLDSTPETSAQDLDATA